MGVVVVGLDESFGAIGDQMQSSTAAAHALETVRARQSAQVLQSQPQFNFESEIVKWNKRFRIRCRCLPDAAVKVVAATAAVEAPFEVFE